MHSKVDKVHFDAESGLWAVLIDTWNGAVGQEYITSSVMSAHLFNSNVEAYAAGLRAVTVLEETNKYPDMCQLF